jgi:phage anti-repressor protein
MSHSNHFVPIFTPIFTSTLGLSVSAHALYEALKPDISYTAWVSQSIRKSYFLKREYSEVRYLIARDRWVNDVFISIPMAHSMCLLQRGHRGISVRNELSITYGDISLKMKRDHRRSLRRTVIPIETISKRAHYWGNCKNRAAYIQRLKI